MNSEKEVMILKSNIRIQWRILQMNGIIIYQTHSTTGFDYPVYSCSYANDLYSIIMNKIFSTSTIFLLILNSIIRPIIRCLVIQNGRPLNKASNTWRWTQKIIKYDLLTEICFENM